MPSPIIPQLFPKKLLALCSEIDNQPYLYAQDAVPESKLKSVLHAPIVLTIITKPIFKDGMHHYDCIARVDHIQLRFVFHDRQSQDKKSYITCYFGDDDKVAGTEFLCKNDKVTEWPIRALHDRYPTFGDYLKEKMELVLAYAAGHLVGLSHPVYPPRRLGQQARGPTP